MLRRKRKILILILATLTTTIHAQYGFPTFISQLDIFLKSINISSSNHNRERLENEDIIVEESYDFIVIGSGSSGAVVANRLSEIPSWKILLLEAGNPGNFFTQIPLLAPLFQLTPYNWNYTMQYQEGVCRGMIDQICAWPKGKALGGSSVINYMIYTRGNPLDYQKWAQSGNPGWSYDEILPYYLKSEDCQLREDICSTSHHRTGGVLPVNYPFKSELTDAFLDAGVELGHKIVDYNSDDYMGFAQIQANIHRGRRKSTADAYIYPIVHKRPNLKILTSTRATKILIDPKTKKATGVRFRRNGRNYIVRTKKEIILSAGVFNSPQLLMLSGIGPARHLRELEIPLLQNLPVGQNLLDHVAYLGLPFRINKTVESKFAFLNPQEILQWKFAGSGIYTSLAGVEAIAYVDTTGSNGSYPDVELIFLGTGSLESDYGQVVAREIRLKPSIYSKVYKPIEQGPNWSIIPMLLHPKSEGFLKLKSKNPYDPPLLYGRYFTDANDEDINTLLRAIRYIQKLSRTKSFQRYNSQQHLIPIPGCEKETFDSDDYWKCALRSLTSTLHHQIGTCKMGPEGVVDVRLRVYGIEGLRVVDSSVIPVTLSAHTNAPCIMLGERAGDLIKEDWGVLN